MERSAQGCRRRFSRFPLTSPVEADGGDGNVSGTSWGMDLGCGGVRISAPQPLPKGRRLLVRLQAPWGPLAREAEVAWTGLPGALAGPTQGRAHGLRFLVPLPAGALRGLSHAPCPNRSLPGPEERTVPIETVSLPDVPIAGGGLFVRCPDPFPLGSPVCLRLLPPGGPSLRLAGRVVWANAGGRNPFPAGMGVQILECQAQERARLRALLEQQATPGRPGMVEAWYAVRPGQPSDAWPSRRGVLRSGPRREEDGASR